MTIYIDMKSRERDNSDDSIIKYLTTNSLTKLDFKAVIMITFLVLGTARSKLNCSTFIHPLFNLHNEASGLGEKKVVLKKNSSCSYFHETLLENFPRLCDAGGFELLCTQHRSKTKLKIFHPKQNAGNNVLHLKEDIASAKIYIRPLQRDLDHEPFEQNQTPKVRVFETCVGNHSISLHVNSIMFD